MTQTDNKFFGILLAALIALLMGCGPEISDPHQEEEYEEYEQHRRLERHYELEWVRCVNEMGIDRCKLIQETGFFQCSNWRFKQEHGLAQCVERRLKDRSNTLPDGDLPEVPQDPTLLEAEEDEPSRSEEIVK